MRLTTTQRQYWPSPNWVWVMLTSPTGVLTAYVSSAKYTSTTTPRRRFCHHRRCGASLSMRKRDGATRAVTARMDACARVDRGRSGSVGASPSDARTESFRGADADRSGTAPRTSGGGRACSATRRASSIPSASM